MIAAEFLVRLQTLLADVNAAPAQRDDLRLRVLVDFILSRGAIDPRDRGQLDAALVALLESATTEAVARAATRLAPRPDTAPRIHAALLARGGPPAAITLRHAPTLKEARLTQVAHGADGALAAAIAGRRPLAAALAAHLFRRPEREVLLALIENPSVALDRATAAWLVSRARHDAALARALLARGPLAFDTTALFLMASREERAAMIVAARRRDLARAPEFRLPPPEALRAALEDACARDDREALTMALTKHFELARQVTKQLVDDAGGEIFALMLNVAGVAPPLARTLIAWRFALAPDERRLDALLRLQQGLAPQTARAMLAAITGRATLVKPTPERRAATRPGADKRLRLQGAGGNRASGG